MTARLFRLALWLPVLRRLLNHYRRRMGEAALAALREYREDDAS